MMVDAIPSHHVPFVLPFFSLQIEMHARVGEIIIIAHLIMTEMWLLHIMILPYFPDPLEH